MFAARLPAFACGFAIVAFALAHEAVAAEQTPIRANTVLLVGAAGATTPESVASSRAPRPAVPHEDEVAEDWAEPSRLLLGCAALFIFLAYRRRSME